MPGMLVRVQSCDEKTHLLETIVNTGMDYILSLGCKKRKANDPPWMHSTPSNLISNRQKALKGAVSYFTHMLRRITNVKAFGQRFQV